MALLSNRVERSEIRPSDHIYTWRVVYAYSHHGTLLDTIRSRRAVPSSRQSSPMMDSVAPPPALWILASVGPKLLTSPEFWRSIYSLNRMPLISNDLYLEAMKADFSNFQRCCRLEWHGLKKWCEKNNLGLFGVTSERALRASCTTCPWGPRLTFGLRSTSR